MRPSPAATKELAGVGGGVYNPGTLLVDAATVIAHNHASDGSDDYFGG